MITFKKLIITILLISLIIPIIPITIEDIIVKEFKIIHIESEKFIKLTITAYTSSVKECDATPYITATGDSVGIGTLGVSRDLIYRKILPFGTKVYIEGFGEQVFIVKDLMNERYKNSADIWMKYRFDAINHGIKKLKITKVLGDSIQVF